MVSPENTPTLADREGPSFRPEVSGRATSADLPSAEDISVAVARDTATVENERMIRRSAEAWNRRDFDGWQMPLAADVQVEVVAEGITLDGSRAARDYAAGWATAFPDAVLDISDIIAGPTGASLEFVFRGTHNGPLNTPSGVVNPTGRHLEARGCWTYIIEDGQVRRARSYYDGAAVMRAIGLLT